MDEQERDFWAIVERAWRLAWALSDSDTPVRELALTGDVSSVREATELFDEGLCAWAKLRSGPDELRDFLATFDRLLFALDREDLATHLGVPAPDRDVDDGELFLSARCFVVCMGERYYRAVLEEPTVVRTRVVRHVGYDTVVELYEDFSGKDVPESGVRLEPGSNVAGWPGLAARAVRRPPGAGQA